MIINTLFRSTPFINLFYQARADLLLEGINQEGI